MKLIATLCGLIIVCGCSNHALNHEAVITFKGDFTTENNYTFVLVDNKEIFRGIVLGNRTQKNSNATTLRTFVNDCDFEFGIYDCYTNKVEENKFSLVNGRYLWVLRDFWGNENLRLFILQSKQPVCPYNFDF